VAPIRSTTSLLDSPLLDSPGFCWTTVLAKQGDSQNRSPRIIAGKNDKPRTELCLQKFLLQIEEPKQTHFDLFGVSVLFKATPGQWGRDNGTIFRQTNKHVNKSKTKLGATLGLGAGGGLNNTIFRAKSIAE
jgi:hypothetical protein